MKPQMILGYLATIGLLSLSPACGDGAPSCETVVRNLPGDKASEKLIKQATKRCKQEKWSAAARTCLRKAENRTERDVCIRENEEIVDLKVRRIPEYKRGLATIHAGASAYLAKHGTLPPSSAEPTPARGSCCAQNGKCKANPAQWTTGAWKALGAPVSGDHYFSYEFTATEKGYTARAYGDLDCDGEYSTIEASAQIEDGRLGELSPLRRERELE
jgi:hypothetical protein